MCSGGMRRDGRTSDALCVSLFQSRQSLMDRQVLVVKSVLLPGLLSVYLWQYLNCTKFCYLDASFCHMVKALAYKAY